MKRAIFLGFDSKEVDAFVVARHSIRVFDAFTPINGLILSDMIKYGHYWRKTVRNDSGLYDVISEAPMSTGFAISRFLTPMLARNAGCDWALFMDADVMIRCDLDELFDLADDKYAVMCVKHGPEKHESGMKMDGQVQTNYKRKNWSSVMLFNCKHPANLRLDTEVINTAPGRDLHGFFWLQDDQIGELPSEWNHLVGVDAPRDDAKIVHYTLGVPSMVGYEECEYAAEWWKMLHSAIR